MTKMIVNGISLEQRDWDVIDEVSQRTGAGRSGAVRLIIREWESLRQMTVFNPQPQPAFEVDQE